MCNFCAVYLNKDSQITVNQYFADYKSDRGRIQTCNRQSRNLMRYSVAPRGQNQNFEF